jgi:hypothetical protein
MTSYCAYLQDHPEDTLNKLYHDNEYGFPLGEDAALLERLTLEIAQAGLSWTLILKRKEAFHRPSKALMWIAWQATARRRLPAFCQTPGSFATV